MKETELKQIEEMANDLAQHCPDLVENCCGVKSCLSCIVNFLYNAGYRKQSEGKWKSGKTINGQWGYSCSICAASFVGENAEWIAKEHDFCPNCGAKMKGE